MNKQLDIEDFATDLTVDRPAVQMLAEQLVAGAGDVEGEFCFATISPEGIQHYTVPNGPDAVDQIVDVVSCNAAQDQNVYFSGALFRTGAIVGNKGRTEENVVAVLMLCADFDRGHDPASRLCRLPCPPGSEVETSPGNYQDHFWLDRPYSAAEAKAVQRALSQSSGADACNSVEHLWRMPGTLNWPTAKKIKAGRSPVPFRARLIVAPEAYDTISIEHLRSSIVASYPQAFDLERQTVKQPSATGKRLSWDGLRARLSWIHPRFDGSRPACYPALSRKRAARPLPYDGAAWLSLALCLRDGNVPLVDVREHDWIGLIEEWSSGDLWFERTGERVDVGDRYPEQGIANRLQGEARDSGRTTGVATVIDYAADGGCPLPPHDERTSIELSPEIQRTLIADNGEQLSASNNGVVSVIEGQIDGSVPGSEDDIAIQYANARARDLKFIPELKKWFAFDGRRWDEISTPVVWNDILPLARSVAQHANSDSVRKKTVSKSTVANVEALLRGNGRHIVALDRWDSELWQLNACGEVIDLRTGKQRDVDATDYCMKSTAVAPAPEGTDLRAACPLWLQTLDKITAGDQALGSFLQRTFGYCLTGITTEHAMFFWYGTGANGKGVLLNTMVRILGDYARIAPVDTFTASNNDRHPTDLAMLRGARLVAAQETDQGRQWAEAKIKALTGGDPITARFMHQDFFEYTPQFKLVIAGNHKPRLKNVDEAMRRRLHLVPFAVTIPEAERDPDLQEKLKAEWAGILRWAIEGCLAWQRSAHPQGRPLGLSPPSAVQAATVEYFSDQDPLESWLAERCVVGQDGWTSSAALYGDYCAYAHREYGTDPTEGTKAFSQRMESHGFRPSRQGKDRTRGFASISLCPAQDFVPDDGEGL